MAAARVIGQFSQSIVADPCAELIILDGGSPCAGAGWYVAIGIKDLRVVEQSGGHVIQPIAVPPAGAGGDLECLYCCDTPVG